MSAYEVTDKLLEVMNNYEVIILNFANSDMVGHTGNMDATIKAVEAVDKNLKRIYEKCKELDFTLIVTADHGNCEQMINDDGTVNTAHTTNLVPFIVVDNNIKLIKDVGTLADIAPTILKIMGIDIPSEMTGNVLIKEGE